MKNNFHTRAFRLGGYSVMASTIIIIIAIVINVLARMIPANQTKIDVTTNHLLSLSDQTKEIVDRLDKELVIYWITQSDKEDEILGALLDRYAALSDYIVVVKKDPDIYPTFTKNYTSETVLNNSLIVTYGDKSKLVGYYDIYEYDYTTYWYNENVEVNFTGENALTSAIYYLLDDYIPRIYVISGHGETQPLAFESAIENENLDLEELSLLSTQSIPSDADCLMISTPQVDYSEDEISMIESFLQDGGSLMLMTNLLTSNETLPNLEKMMSTYGVTLEKGVVLEADENYFISGHPHYLIPELQSHTITAPLLNNNYHILLPITQALHIQENLPENISVYSLAITSEASYVKPAGYAITTEDKEDGDIEGPFSVAVSIAHTVENGDVSRIVWVPCGALIDEDTNQKASNGNLNFFLNSLNWLCGKENGISIHAKSITNESLVVSGKAFTIWAVILVILIPSAYLCIGFCVHARRKRK